MKKTRRLAHYPDCPYLEEESKICTCSGEPKIVDEEYLDKAILGKRGEGGVGDGNKA